MLARAINFILSYTKLGEFLNEKKTLIGAVLLVIGAVIEVLEKLSPMFPEVAFLGDAKQHLRDALETLQHYLELGGYGFITVGLTHKAAKAKLAKDEKN